jgi:hypothetical protein
MWVKALTLVEARAVTKATSECIPRRGTLVASWKTRSDIWKSKNLTTPLTQEVLIRSAGHVFRFSTRLEVTTKQVLPGFEPGLMESSQLRIHCDNRYTTEP